MSFFGASSLASGSLASTGGSLGISTANPTLNTGVSGQSTSLFGGSSSQQQPGSSFFSSSSSTSPHAGGGLFGSSNINTSSQPGAGLGLTWQQPSSIGALQSTTTGTGSLGLFGSSTSPQTLQNVGLQQPTTLMFSNTSPSSPPNASSPATGVPGGMTADTEYYLRTVEKRMAALQQADSSLDYLHFTLSASAYTTIPDMFPQQNPAATMNNALEQEVIQLNDPKLMARFMKAKSDNTDLNQIFIVPIRGLKGLQERNQIANRAISELDQQAEALKTVARQCKSHIEVISQQTQRIAGADQALRFKLIHILKLIEDEARRRGRYEFNSTAAKKNQQLIKKFDEVYNLGQQSNELAVIAETIKKLKQKKIETNSETDGIINANTLRTVNRILEQQKRSIQRFFENLNKLESFVSAFQGEKI